MRSVGDDLFFCTETNASSPCEEQTMKKNGLLQSSLSRRQLLKGAVSTAAVVSASSFIGAGYAQSGPEAVTQRVRESFDFGWKFRKGDSPDAEAPEFFDADWRTLDLPHDWSIEGGFDANAPSSYCGAYLPAGIGRYRKQFRVPDSYKDRKLTIEFDGIYQLSEVWINGHYLGKRPYGYVPFFYDLTPHVKFGSENVIAVKVDNSHQTNCRWYSGSGIYRHTWLLSTNKIHIAHCGTFVSSPQIAKETATLHVSTRVSNESGNAASCTLVTTVIDHDGNAIQSSETTQDIAPGKDIEFLQQIKVPSPRLWSVANPYMYKVRSKLQGQGRMGDEYETPVGIREAVFDADRGFLLN